MYSGQQSGKNLEEVPASMLALFVNEKIKQKSSTQRDLLDATVVWGLETLTELGVEVVWKVVIPEGTTTKLERLVLAKKTQVSQQKGVKWFVLRPTDTPRPLI